MLKNCPFPLFIFPRLEMEDYEELQSLGKGEYGEVKMVKSRKDGKIYAMKITPIYEEGTGLMNLQEIDIMSRIRHPHIICLIDFFFTKDNSYVIMPIGDTTLTDFIQKEKHDISVLVRLFYEIASAVIFLHQNNILCVDLKPDNIIIKDGSAILIDFGISIYLPTHVIPRGTPRYEAPEAFFYGMSSLGKRKYLLFIRLLICGH